MTTNDSFDHLGARIYGLDDATEADSRGGRVYGHNEDMDAHGERVYGLGDRGALSYQQHTAGSATTEPEPWKLDEVRRFTDVGSHDDLDTIGARIETGHNGYIGCVAVDNRTGRGDTPGIPGFDY